MKTELIAPPWIKPNLTPEIMEAVELLQKDVWREASILFTAERENKLRQHQSTPKGMQKVLNNVIQTRFHSNNWEGNAGYFFKNRTWVRITFRHQMSLGSDILDAIKACKNEGMELAAILAADSQTLKVISPNDAKALISFEKLSDEIQMNLNGIIDIPLLIGKLTRFTSASNDINLELRKARPRDVSIPAQENKNL